MSYEKSLIGSAARFAALAHAGQIRKYSASDTPYIVHPMRVAGRVSLQEGVSDEMIAAAWLHDVLEDTSVSEGELRSAFGDEVADLVVELTNTSKSISGLSRAGRRKVDHERLSLVSKDAKIIKLADRLDNLSDLKDDPLVPEGFRKLYVEESLSLIESLRGTGSPLEKVLDEKIKEMI